MRTWICVLGRTLSLLLLVGQLSILVYGDTNSDDDSSPEVCETEIRHRMPWNTLSREEKSLYVEGFQYLRKNKVLHKITQAHSRDRNDLFVHYSSVNFYWHAYVLYELETAIRNLGGKFACFALPYWDASLDAGNEDDPLILHSGLGGDGDALNDNCVVNDEYYSNNEFNWQTPSASLFKNGNDPKTMADSFYWSPWSKYCADGETYPYCCLKRSKSSSTTLLSASEIGFVIKKRKSVYAFNYWISYAHAKFHALFAGQSVQFEHGYSSDDPIFFVFHAWVDYVRLMWQSCHGYDSIAKGDLHLYPNVYHSFCLEPGKYITAHECQLILKKRKVGIDDEFVLRNICGLDGAVCANGNGITVRDMFDAKDWNYKYELGDFYGKANLDLWCTFDNSKLNSDWFEESTDYSENTVTELHEYIGSEKVKMVNSEEMHSSDDIVRELAMKSCEFVREQSGNSCWNKEMESVEIGKCDGEDVEDLQDLLNENGVSDNECLVKVRRDSWQFATNSDWFGTAQKSMLCDGMMDYHCRDSTFYDDDDVENGDVVNDNELLQIRKVKQNYPMFWIVFCVVVLVAFSCAIQTQCASKKEKSLTFEYGSFA